MSIVKNLILILAVLSSTACAANVVPAEPEADKDHAMITFAPSTGGYYMNSDQAGGMMGAGSDWEVFTHGAVHFTFQSGPCVVKPCAMLGKAGYADGVLQMPDGDDLTVRHAAQQQIGLWLGMEADPAFFGPAQP